MRTATPCLVLLLCACSPAASTDTDTDTDSDTPAGSGTGRLALRFTMDTAVVANMRDDDVPVGTFRGSFYLGDEATNLGPIDGAEDLGGILAENVDVTDGGPTEVLFTSEALPVDYVKVLGFLDADGNADASDPGPDAGDPVTLPNQNEFLVVEDETTVVDVFFGLLNP